MARARTSDPGRVRALHYAATARQRHDKPLVYACLGPTALGLGLRLSGVAGLGLLLGSVALAQQAAVPCAGCQAFSVTSSHAAPVTADLHDTRVLSGTMITRA